MQQAVVITLIIGGLIGLFVGRVWAEIFRARFDMQRTWQSRKAYRRGEQRHFLPLFVILAAVIALYMISGSA